MRILAVLLGAPLLALAEPPHVQTTAGPITGEERDGVLVFKGVPYGADTATTRFAPPRPPEPWSAPRECREFGPMALQPAGRGKPSAVVGRGAEESEDCLRLNVWTPTLHDGRSRPILVYFHGGAYNGGTANDALLDGARLARAGDAVVVTVNHRLNGFGFLWLGEAAAAEFPESANVGMLDLVLALRWVRDNAREFGGDPGCVTIFGQSGGGAKCATLMAMPAARGLFHRVWTMSGQQLTGRTRAHAAATARAMLAQLGLPPERSSELRTMPRERLAAAMAAVMGGQAWTPVVDGAVLPRDPFAPDASPLSAGIPMVLGNMLDETRGLIGGGNPELFALDWAGLPAALARHLAPFIGALPPERIVAEYRALYPHYTPADVFFAASTAARSWRGMVLETERRAQQRGARTWAYHVTWRSPFEDGKWGAPHGVDIALLFGTLEQDRLTVAGGAAAARLSAAMMQALLTFARTGDPNCAALPEWRRYDTTQRPTMLFQTRPACVDDPRGAERALFSPIEYVQPGT
ncbi:MAG: carboxylesterase family protein [Opitutaceae bacterium]